MPGLCHHWVHIDEKVFLLGHPHVPGLNLSVNPLLEWVSNDAEGHIDDELLWEPNDLLQTRHVISEVILHANVL